ncbi:putative mitogen-activated protein kinase kinase kinase 7-like [Drosophila mojavensis]|uniref:putative mitogen-activated protein kinase kinase kinase 7-like n=1 Tax=Drosophila mojavensis TaxID=7230 RepID=UPI0013EE9E71|nr:putative mitogen-activated protein kinase kinase kinase 7-like [Drosophila mojavensis]
MAIKEIAIDPKTWTDNKNVHRELFYLEKVNGHALIVQLYGLIMEETAIHLVMEYVAGGSLFHFLHNTRDELTYSQAITLLRQAAEALAYLHSFEIIHRDVKSQNMLLDAERRNLKICDFGFVRELEKDMTKGKGTPLYMAPELATVGSYSSKCDVYSMGITIWEVLAREIPYESPKVYGPLWMILNLIVRIN